MKKSVLPITFHQQLNQTAILKKIISVKFIEKQISRTLLQFLQ